MYTKLLQADQFLSNVESALNRSGWIPIVNFISAPIRMLVGKIEVLASVLFAAITFVQAVLKRDRYLLSKTVDILTYSLHGLANMVRAAVEIVPLSFFATLFYDAMIGRCNYRYETMEVGVYPLIHSPYRIA